MKNSSELNPQEFISAYALRLKDLLSHADWSGFQVLVDEMHRCWCEKRQVFICGNGGSAGNAIHLANDFLYGVAKATGKGIKVSALSANPAVITCLANDVGYEYIFSEQLAVQAQSGDLLIALSGSGNSPNILRALEQANLMKVSTVAILGFDGGASKSIAKTSIHFPIKDMQIAEDMQLIVGHVLMQYLKTMGAPV